MELERHRHAWLHARGEDKLLSSAASRRNKPKLFALLFETERSCMDRAPDPGEMRRTAVPSSMPHSARLTSSDRNSIVSASSLRFLHGLFTSFLRYYYQFTMVELLREGIISSPWQSMRRACPFGDEHRASSRLRHAASTSTLRFHTFCVLCVL